MNVAVFGATSKTGRPLVRALCDCGHRVVALSRAIDNAAAIDGRALPRSANLTEQDTVREGIHDADWVVSLAHARFTDCILSAVPARCERLVLTGSVRKYTTLADPAAADVRAAEVAFLASGRKGVMLHASMIYGAADDRNVGRILDFLRSWPEAVPLVVPLPDGGRRTVQPIFVDDMVAAIVGALTRAEAVGPTIDVVGPEPITYAEMVRVCAAAVGKRVIVLPFPVGVAASLASLATRFGVPLPFDAASIRRAGESKRFSTRAMCSQLGVMPRPFEEGVRQKIAREEIAGTH